LRALAQKATWMKCIAKRSCGKPQTSFRPRNAVGADVVEDRSTASRISTQFSHAALPPNGERRHEPQIRFFAKRQDQLSIVSAFGADTIITS
jgi:hypothetical protein